MQQQRNPLRRWQSPVPDEPEPALRTGRLGLSQGIQLIASTDKKNTMGRHGSAVYRTCELHLGNHFLRLTLLQDDHVTILIAKIDFAIDQKWRRPDNR